MTGVATETAKMKTSTPMNMDTRVTIFPSFGLGDSLIQLTLAYNLAQSGCHVTYYSDHVWSLGRYVTGVEIRPIPNYADVEALLRSAEIILYDSGSGFLTPMPAELKDWFAANAVCYSMTHGLPQHQSVTAAALRRRLASSRKSQAEKWLRLNRSVRSRSFGLGSRPVAQQLAKSAGDLLGLKSVTFDNGLRIPRNRTPGHPDRVIIHPTSGNPVKNWSPRYFVQLAYALKVEGWQVAFSVAASERDAWLATPGACFETPQFESLCDLAHYYADSAAFIGNDSGCAHLASCIGLPNLVIFKRWRRYPPWRPAWTAPRVVFPRTLDSKDWQNHLSAFRVHEIFKQMMAGVVRSL